MQIALHTQSTVDAYIAGKQWREARLADCPLHPMGGCGLVRHGSYARTTPLGLRVARWYCPEGHRTFSLLPNFLAVRLPCLLMQIEIAVAAVAQGGSIESVAANLREFEVTLPSAVRWLQRRLRPIRAAICTLVAQDLVPKSVVLGSNGFLERLRQELDPAALEALPPPLGWLRASVGNGTVIDGQHEVGPDEPVISAYCDETASIPSQCPHPSVCALHVHPPNRRSCGSGAPTIA